MKLWILVYTLSCFACGTSPKLNPEYSKTTCEKHATSVRSLNTNNIAFCVEVEEPK